MSRHYLFESMSKDRLRHIAAKFKAINLKAQESVFQIGDNSNGMFYILEKGTLEVKFPGGRCTKLKPGQCFGDVALLYQCERCMTVRTLVFSHTHILICLDSLTCSLSLSLSLSYTHNNNHNQVQAGNEECVIWSLTSEEFYKVKKLRYVFKYRSIQKAVYRRILKGHRKTLHSLVASYMIDQKKRREKLRSRFGKKTNALKAALLWSIQTKHNVPIPAEEDSVMTIKDAQKEREKRNSSLKIHHGMSFAEGSDKAKCPNLALAMVMKRATNKFARGKNKRSSRRFSDYLAVLRDEIRNLEDAPRDKEDQEIAELRKEKYSALALTHAGDITEHMETVSTVHSSLAESTIAFSKSMDTQKQSNGGLFGGNLGEIQEGADGSDEDGGGFDEEDNDDDDNFEDNFEALRNMVMERKSKVQTDGTLVHVNESFQNGAGLTERMCSHLLMSRIRSAITLGQVHKAAIAASEVRDHSMALKWYVLSLSLSFFFFFSHSNPLFISSLLHTSGTTR
jgi:CRP-like cAMP-binding protein